MTLIESKVFKDNDKQRTGRGFSREELKKAGSSMKIALKLGLRIDAKRKTVYDQNVEALKTFIQEKKKAESQKALEKSEKEPELASKGKKPAGKPKKQKGKPKS